MKDFKRQATLCLSLSLTLGLLPGVALGQTNPAPGNLSLVSSPSPATLDTDSLLTPLPAGASRLNAFTVALSGPAGLSLLQVDDSSLLIYDAPGFYALKAGVRTPVSLPAGALSPQSGGLANPTSAPPSLPLAKPADPTTRAGAEGGGIPVAPPSTADTTAVTNLANAKSQPLQAAQQAAPPNTSPAAAPLATAPQAAPPGQPVVPPTPNSTAATQQTSPPNPPAKGPQSPALTGGVTPSKVPSPEMNSPTTFEKSGDPAEAALQCDLLLLRARGGLEGLLSVVAGKSGVRLARVLSGKAVALAPNQTLTRGMVASYRFALVGEGETVTLEYQDGNTIVVLKLGANPPEETRP